LKPPPGTEAIAAAKMGAHEQHVELGIATHSECGLRVPACLLDRRMRQPPLRQLVCDERPVQASELTPQHELLTTKLATVRPMWSSGSQIHADLRRLEPGKVRFDRRDLASQPRLAAIEKGVSE
jgi:hypothetical protein